MLHTLQSLSRIIFPRLQFSTSTLLVQLYLAGKNQQPQKLTKKQSLSLAWQTRTSVKQKTQVVVPLCSRKVSFCFLLNKEKTLTWKKKMKMMETKGDQGESSIVLCSSFFKFLNIANQSLSKLLNQCHLFIIFFFFLVHTFL